VKVWGKNKCKTCVVRFGKFTGKKGGQEENKLKEVRQLISFAHVSKHCNR